MLNILLIVLAEFCFENLSKWQYIPIKKDRVGIACNWIKDDQKSEIKPCMLSITASNENGKLNFQLHSRACNIYDKLLMNLQEFITVQKYIASRCNLKIGRFTMFIDYAQISVKDKMKVENKIGIKKS